MKTNWVVPKYHPVLPYPISKSLITYWLSRLYEATHKSVTPLPALNPSIDGLPIAMGMERQPLRCCYSVVVYHLFFVFVGWLIKLIVLSACTA